MSLRGTVRPLALTSCALAIVLGGCSEEQGEVGAGEIPAARFSAIPFEALVEDQCSRAPATDSRIALQPNWSAGDRFGAQVIRGVDGTNANAPSFPAGLEVEGADRKGAALSWQTADGMVDLLRNELPDAGSAFASHPDLAGANRVTYAADASGAFSEITNPQKLADVGHAVADELEGRGDSRAADVAEALRAQADSGLLVARSAIEPQLIHLVFGRTLPVGKRISVSGPVPNPLGGDDLPGTIDYEIKDLGTEFNNCVHVYIVVRPSTEALVTAIAEQRESMGLPELTDEELEEVTSFGLTLRANVSWDYKRRLPVYIDGAVETATNVDLTTIRIVPSKP